MRYEEFHRKTGYIHFCQFEIFAIEAAEIKVKKKGKENNKKICDTFDHNFKNIPLHIMN